MNCKNVKEYLTLAADGEKILEDYIEEHIKNCDSCKKYYENILKSKEIISEKSQYNSVNIDAELSKLKQKIKHTENNSNKKKIYNILFKNTTRKVAVTVVLCILIISIPLNNASIVKGLTNFWCNKIVFHKSNIKIEEENYEVNVSQEYPEQFKLLQERHNLISETIKLEDKETAYEKVDQIVEEYDEKIWNANKKNFKGMLENKKYTDLELLQKETNFKVPLVPENFKFINAKYYIDDYAKMLDFSYNDINNNNRLNYIRKPLYIKYVYPNKLELNRNTTFPKGTKFKDITIKNNDGYILMQKDSKDDIFISVCVFTNNCNTIVSTLCKETDLQKNEEMLLKIIESLI